MGPFQSSRLKQFDHFFDGLATNGALFDFGCALHATGVVTAGAEDGFFGAGHADGAELGGGLGLRRMLESTRILAFAVVTVFAHLLGLFGFGRMHKLASLLSVARGPILAHDLALI